MRECLLTQDNPSVQNKSSVSLKPINFKLFYIKPYLNHESEIRFAEAEMKKLGQMGILRRGPVNFCPLSCLSKSHIQVPHSIKHQNIA